MRISFLIELNLGGENYMNLLLIVIVVPISLMLHEIGHGIGTALTSKTHHVHIYLGDVGDNNKENFQVGRFHFHLQWAFNGRCRWGGGLNKQQAFFSLLGGPILTALIMILCVFLLKLDIEGWLRIILIAFAEINLYILIFTLVPNQLPRRLGPNWSFPSDGLQIVRLLRNE